MGIIETFFETIMPQFLERLLSILLAPIAYQEMVWILLPAITTLVLMTVYFGRYKKEELGWNTAVGNALVLIFISLNLFEQAYPQENPLQALNSFVQVLLEHGFFAQEILPGLVSGVIMVYAAVLLLLDFFHAIPKNVAFFISSPLPITTIAYFGIVFVYSATANNPLALDGYTLASFIAIFIVLYAMLGILQVLEPDKKDEERKLFMQIRDENKQEPIENEFVEENDETTKKDGVFNY